MAAEIAKRSALSLTGLMFYDAQIAGLPDTSAAVRVVKGLSARELLDRRGEVISAVREFADLRLINGGGTGSPHVAISQRSRQSSLSTRADRIGASCTRSRPISFACSTRASTTSYGSGTGWTLVGRSTMLTCVACSDHDGSRDEDV